MWAVSHDEQARWAQEFEEDGGVVFPSSRAKMALVLLGCIAFSAVGIWLLLRGDAVSVVVGSLSIAFFGFVGIPTTSWRLVTRKPVVRVDHDGVSSGQRRALWAEIEGFWVWSVSSSAAVIVRLTPAGGTSVRAQAHPALRWLCDLNERMVGPSTMSLPSGNGFDPYALALWLNSVLAGVRGDASSGPSEAEHSQSPDAGATFVPDWPKAAIRPGSPPDPETGFEAGGAPPSAVALLQWTSGVLVDGVRGPGSWDLISLDGWAAGDLSDAITGLGDLDTERDELRRTVGAELGHGVSLAPDTWVFAREDGKSWWMAPLLVVHRSD
jgi:hypothetical protein